MLNHLHLFHDLWYGTPRNGTQEGVRGCQAPDPVPPAYLTCPGGPAGAPKKGPRDAKPLDPHTSHPPPHSTTMSPDGVLTHGVQRCTAIHEGRCCQQARTGTSDEDGSEEGNASPSPLPLPRPHPPPPQPAPPPACGGPHEAPFCQASPESEALEHPRAAQEAFDGLKSALSSDPSADLYPALLSLGEKCEKHPAQLHLQYQSEMKRLLNRVLDESLEDLHCAELNVNTICSRRRR